MPYRTEITPFIEEGKNVIEVEVVNTWMNRIIGDLQLPENERKVKPDVNPWKANSPLQEAGLIGPVKIISLSNFN
jgi:hypothetical protein